MLQMTWKTLIAVVLCAITVGGLGAGTALAGENKGNGGKIEINANSECAFSGLDETAAHPGGDDDDDFLVSQSFGQGVRLSGEPPMGRAVPSFACNGHLSPLHSD
jgi:hypothetical protein